MPEALRVIPFPDCRRGGTRLDLCGRWHYGCTMVKGTTSDVAMITPNHIHLPWQRRFPCISSIGTRQVAKPWAMTLSVKERASCEYDVMMTCSLSTVPNAAGTSVTTAQLKIERIDLILLVPSNVQPGRRRWSWARYSKLTNVHGSCRLQRAASASYPIEQRAENHQPGSDSGHGPRYSRIEISLANQPCSPSGHSPDHTNWSHDYE